MKEKKLKNDRNALIDVKMNINYDVKIFRRGAMFIQGAMSIPDSRVWQSRAHKETLQKLNRTDKKMQGPFKYSQNNSQLIYSWKLEFEVERTSSRSQILDRDVNFYMKHCLFEPET